MRSLRRSTLQASEYHAKNGESVNLSELHTEEVPKEREMLPTMKNGKNFVDDLGLRQVIIISSAILFCTLYISSQQFQDSITFTSVGKENYAATVDFEGNIPTISKLNNGYEADADASEQNGYSLSATTGRPSEAINAIANTPKVEGLNVPNGLFFNILPPPEEPDAVHPVHPAYTCSKAEDGGVRSTKIAFVHIFKTAGSTVRGLFKRYATSCGAGTGLVVACSSVESSSIVSPSSLKDNPESQNQKLNTTSLWFNPERKSYCNLKSFTPRKAQIRKKDKTPFRTGKFTTDFLTDNIDLLVGHFPLGAPSLVPAWKHDEGLAISQNTPGENDVKYIAFFRNAAMKYISSKLFTSKGHLTLEEHVKRISKKVREARSKNGYYQNYKTYLTTPEQREFIKESGYEMNVEKYTNLICHNLMHYNILIGVVERMDETMQMLHYFMDAENEISPLFSQFGMSKTIYEVAAPSDKSAETSQTKPRMSNVSAVSSKSVYEEMKKDKKVFEMLIEFVKYEQQITDFASKLHEFQYNGILQTIKESAP